MDAAPNLSLPALLPPDLAVFGTNDVAIKLWLPEKLTLSLDAMSARHGSSRPDVLRWLLFEHVYGRPALEQLKDWKRKRDAETAEASLRSDEGRVGFEAKLSPRRADPSERTITAQLLGKSVEDIKLWVPSPLKRQLDALAMMEGLGLSDYLRITLVRILLGEAFHHQWRLAVGKLSKEVQRFEQGGDI